MTIDVKGLKCLVSDTTGQLHCSKTGRLQRGDQRRAVFRLLNTGSKSIRYRANWFGLISRTNTTIAQAFSSIDNLLINRARGCLTSGFENQFRRSNERPFVRVFFGVLSNEYVDFLFARRRSIRGGTVGRARLTTRGSWIE
jgi:hypothetical protein